MQTNEPQMFSEISSSNLPLDLLHEPGEMGASKGFLSPRLNQCPIVTDHFSVVSQVIPNPVTHNYQNLESEMSHHHSFIDKGGDLSPNPIIHTIDAVKDATYSYCDIDNYKSDLRCDQNYVGVSPSLSLDHDPEKVDSHTTLSVLSKEACPPIVDVPCEAHYSDNTSCLSPNCDDKASIKTRGKPNTKTHFPIHSSSEDILMKWKKKGNTKSVSSLKRKKGKHSKPKGIQDMAMKLALHTLRDVHEQCSDRSFWFARYLENELRSFSPNSQTQFITHVLKILHNYKEKSFVFET